MNPVNPLRFSATFRVDPSMITHGPKELANNVELVRETVDFINTHTAQLEALHEDMVLTHQVNEQNQEGVLIQYQNQSYWQGWNSDYLGGGKYSRHPAEKFLPQVLDQATFFQTGMDLVKATEKGLGPRLMGEA